MKVMAQHKYGSPREIYLENIPTPIPNDDEVLIKVHAVSINSWDWDTLSGKPYEYRLASGLFKPKSKLLHGCDIAGVIEAIGKNVTQFKVGDAVFTDLEEAGWGAFSEYLCTKALNLTMKPSSMSFEDAACLPHGGNLAVQALISKGKIKEGQSVLINGGGGSTGTLAIQIAKSFSTTVTAVDSTDKLELMKELGADYVVDYTKEDVTKLGKKYDLIFDVKTMRSAFDFQTILSEGGTYATVGGYSLRIIQVALLGLFSKKYKMHMIMYKANQESNYLVQLYKTGKLKPVIDKVYSLEETAQAFEYFGKGDFKGKVVVKIAD